MKTLLIAAIIFLAPLPALGHGCPDFPPGPALDQLTALCDDLRVHRPDWVPADCCEYFVIVGGRTVYEAKKVKEAAEAKKQAIRDSMATFDANLPLPELMPGVGIGLPTPTP